MELSKHIGFQVENDISLWETVVRAKAIFTLLVLAGYLFFYHFISIFCSMIHYAFPETSDEIKRIFASSFWNLCIYCLTLNDFQFKVSGDELDPDSAILLSNHLSLADHFVMAYLANYSIKKTNSTNLENRIRLPRINFFSWFTIWRLPTLRIFFNMAKCDENWELDESILEVVFSEVLHSKTPEWLVLFPEVNILTEGNLLLQKQQSERLCLPVLNNLLYPRFSGIFNVVTAINKKNSFKFTKIYDITILYQREGCVENIFRAPTLVETFASSSSPITVHIIVKARFLSRLPSKRAKLERYIEHAWIDKDKQLAQLKEKQTFEIQNSQATKNCNSPLYSAI
ncbi:hypothetical protein DFJ63DRAFT_152573 [Scheffersomyces coipomensis]|uniref:uncharacterized protein n=1 Tax=Scheffersomyces coipomensis TaxID=1788519 RepID=UPI00315CAF9B